MEKSFIDLKYPMSSIDLQEAVIHICSVFESFGALKLEPLLASLQVGAWGSFWPILLL